MKYAVTEDILCIYCQNHLTIDQEYSIVAEQLIVSVFVYLEQSRTFPQEMTKDPFKSRLKQEFIMKNFKGRK